MFLTDTHCHLNLKQFDHDREEVLRRAIDDANIFRILIPSLDNNSGIEIIKLCGQYKQHLFLALGIHPNSMVDNINLELNILRKNLVNENAVCLGEIGLDYYRKINTIEQQIQLFKSQLELAAEFNLPVCIHNRDAENDLLKILSEWYADIRKNQSRLMHHPGVLHAFNGSSNLVKKTIEMNFYYGIGGMITFPNNHEYRQLIKSLPLNRILAETDAPYLSPHPWRGKRNEPSQVIFIIKELAKIFGVHESEIIQITSNNAQALLLW